VQKPFERGVALMHSFEFEQSDLQFQEIARQDPHCAMAYWGQAMSIYHQLWSRPTRTDLKDGSALLRQARLAKPPTQRENDYINALSVFYQGYPNLSHEKRVGAYAKAMEKLPQRYPNDLEAAVWYALALLAADYDDPEQQNRKKAIELLTRLFEQAPDHPGIAHYLIHACDQPQFAAQGLAAAQKYAAIAASSPHAVHMPSHIFARLGLWQDDIKSNLAAIEVANAQAAHMEVIHHKLHAMDFLEYAYLQIGEDDKARAIVDQVLSMPKDEGENGGEYYNYARAEFPALLALETRQWKQALALEPPNKIEPWNQAITFWAKAVAAGHLRDAASARAAVSQYNAMVGKVRKSKTPYEADNMETYQEEAHAWLAFAQGKNEEALKRLGAVADDQDETGKGEVELPAREMLADMLLEMNRPEEALVEYEKSLTIDPNRFNGLSGAARAAQLAHQPEKAASFYARLLKNCEGATSERVAQLRAKLSAGEN
jgi:tetratricopeptide (TPR) repeat protein